MGKLNTITDIVFSQNKQKGFWDQRRNVGELLMLITSELGEAMEAHRCNRFACNGVFEREIKEGVEPKDCFEKNIKDTFEDEITDAIIRLFDLCGGLGIDLDFHFEKKMEYNLKRPKLHGKSY